MHTAETNMARASRPRCCGRFNEAAACTPRKLGGNRPGKVAGDVASMRPRRAHRGNLVRADTLRGGGRAASMRPRRAHRGNAFSDAEELHPHIRASMRPRRAHRGNDAGAHRLDRQYGVASMRPRRAHRGNDAFRRGGPSPIILGFNEAAACTPRKPLPDGPAAPTRSCRLQ